MKEFKDTIEMALAVLRSPVPEKAGLKDKENKMNQVLNHFTDYFLSRAFPDLAQYSDKHHFIKELAASLASMVDSIDTTQP